MKPDEPQIDPALPTTVTPSGRVVYDPFKAPRVEVDAQKAGELKRLLGELHAVENSDARDAVPVPVSLSPTDSGALITAEGQDAAKAHVEAAVPAPGPSGRIDSAAVKVVDPRRAPTVRIEKKSPWIPGSQEAFRVAPAPPELIGAIPAEAEAGPSSEAPSSRPPSPSVTERRAEDSGRALAGAGSRKHPGDGASAKRGAAIAIGSVVVAAVVAFWALRAPPEDPRGSATNATGAGATESAHVTPMASGAPSAAVSGTASSEPSSTSVAPETTGTVQAPVPATATSTKSAAPRTSSEPHGDAGTAPKPTATAEPTSAPVVTSLPAVTSVPPAVSSAPSSKPSASNTPSPSDTTFVIRPKGSTTP